MHKNSAGYHISQLDRKKVNVEVCDIAYAEDLGKTIKFIDSVLRRNNLMLVNEDTTPFEAIFCGTEGNIKIDVGTQTQQAVVNTVLVFQWYKLTTKYEINAYLS